MKNKENLKSGREFWIKIFRDVYKYYITVHKKNSGASKINYNFKKSFYKRINDDKKLRFAQIGSV